MPEQNNNQSPNADDLVGQWAQEAQNPGSEVESTIKSWLETPQQEVQYSSGPLSDYAFSHDTGLHKTLTAFNQGAESMWGAAKSYLFSNSDRSPTLDSLGVPKEVSKGIIDTLKNFNEAFIRPVVQPFSELLGGSMAAGQEIGHQLVGTAEATASEAENASQGTLLDKALAYPEKGIAAAIGGTGKMLGAASAGQFIPEGELGFHVADPDELLRARAKGLIGEGEKGYFNTKVPIPDELKGRETAASLVGETLGKIVPPKLNLDDLARQIAPDTFQDYDNLTAKASTLQNTLNNISDARSLDPDVQAVQKTIDNILGKVNGVEDRLTKNQAAKLADARSQLDNLMSQSTPEIDDIQTQLHLTKAQIREMSPVMDRIYKHAQNLMPEGDELDRVNEAAEAEDKEALKEETEVPTPTADTEIPDTDDIKQKTKDINAIYQDAKNKLISIGRAPEQADAEAKIVATHYMSRADRLQGQSGSGLDLYNSEFPELKEGGEPTGKTLNQYTGTIAAQHSAEVKDNYELAQVLEEHAIPMDKIRRATGWFKSPYDNKWRYEISDENAELNSNFENLPESKAFGEKHETTLGEVLDHPLLYKLYPEARDIKVTKQGAFFDIFKQVQGWFDKDKNLLNITPHAKDPLTTALHEIQHWIQAKEGFARGGNTQTVLSDLPPEKLESVAKDALLGFQKNLEDISKGIEKLKGLSKDFDSKDSQDLKSQIEHYRNVKQQEADLWEKVTNKEIPTTVWNPVYKEVMKLQHDIRETIFGIRDQTNLSEFDKKIDSKIFNSIAKNEDLSNTFKSLTDSLQKDFVDLKEQETKIQSGDVKAIQDTLDETKLFGLYQKIAGEIEARDTQFRAKMSDAERGESAPYSKEGIPPEDAIVTYNQDSKYLNQTGRKGALTLVSKGKNILRLFASADESTFMHEMGHQWLEELQEDAARPDAPDELKQDHQTVRDWLGAKEGEPLTRAQHEKFARGFERYLREGKAPTSQLQAVFDKFKEWLTQIYATVSKLRAPITDDIRGVYDRIIAHGDELPIGEEAEGESFRTNAHKIADEHQDEVTRLETEGMQNVGKKVEPTEETAQSQVNYADLLREVKGTGETKVRGTARSIESRAIEEGIIDNLGDDLPQYQTMNFKDEADWALNLLKTNPEDAMKMAMGLKPVPEGHIPESIFLAVERDALAKGDIETLTKLASQSRLVSQHTEMGRRIAFLGQGGDHYDFATLYQKINKARKTLAEKIGQKIGPLSREKTIKLADSVRNYEQAEANMKINPDDDESRMNYGYALLDLKDTINELTPGHHTFVENLENVLNIPRSLQTTLFHWSAPWTMNWGMMSRGAWWEGWAHMRGYFTNEANFRELQATIYASKWYKHMKKAGLSLTDLSDNLTDREEAIQSNLLEKANEYFKEKYGVPNFIRANSRAFTGYNNFVRYRVFEQLMNAAELQGYDVSVGSKVSRELADVVNNFTGRGRINGFEALQAAANSTVFYAPRKNLAMFNMWNPWTYINPNLSNIARKAAMRQLIGSILITGGIMALAKACGFDTNLNRLSSDFGKINIGGEKFDFSGGSLSYLRLLNRLQANQMVTSHGKLIQLGEGFKPITRLSLISEFARNKLAPVASFLTDALAGSDAIGNPFSLTREARDKLLPITIGEFVDFAQNNPKDSAAYLPAVFAMFGVYMQSPMPAVSEDGISYWGDPSNPFSPAPLNDIDKEMDKLGMNENHYLPPNTINGVTLTQSQYDKYLTYSGHLAKQQLLPLIRSDGWSRIPDQYKKLLIKQIIEGSREAAQTSIMADSLGSKNDIFQKAQQKRLGLTQ